MQNQLEAAADGDDDSVNLVIKLNLAGSKADSFITLHHPNNCMHLRLSCYLVSAEPIEAADDDEDPVIKLNLAGSKDDS